VHRDHKGSNPMLIRQSIMKHFPGSFSSSRPKPWLSESVTKLLSRRPGFDSGPSHVRYVVAKVVLGQIFPFSAVNITPTMLHSHHHLNTHSSIQKDERGSPEVSILHNVLPSNGEHWTEQYFHIFLSPLRG